MAIYQGRRTEEGISVRKDAQPFLPDESLKVAFKSPAGFEWGYEGSGPAQLALALLLDVTKNEEVSLRMYQQFKRELVARFDHKRWDVTSEGIRGWIVQRLKEGVGKGE